MAGLGSTAVTPATLGARFNAKRPGPEPTSMTVLRRPATRRSRRRKGSSAAAATGSRAAKRRALESQ